MEVKEPEREIDGFLKGHLLANLLKWAAGQHIFCPGCDSIMDWQDTVILEWKGRNTGKTVATKTLCGGCADKLTGLNLAKAEAKAGEPIDCERTDGRDWSVDEDGNEEFAPAPAPVLGEPITFGAARPGGTEFQVAGNRIGGFPDWGVEWVVYPNPDGKYWWVCELSTGFAAAGGETLKEAYTKAFRRLRTVKKSKFQKTLAEARQAKASIKKALAQ